MMRNLKAMGLAMFALLALGALGAQSASAVVEHSFTSAADTTVLTGTTESGTKERFELTGANIECEDVTYRGTVIGKKVDHVSVYPVFGDGACTGTAGAAVVHNDGCTYTFGSDTFENATHFGAGALHANVSMACDHPDDNVGITITSGGCTITVETTHSPNITVNHNLPGIRYTEIEEEVTTSGGAKDKVKAITVEATVRTIKGTTKGANCVLLGLGNPGTHINGKYTGKATVTCYEDKQTFHPHTESATEGALVNCGISTP